MALLLVLALLFTAAALFSVSPAEISYSEARGNRINISLTAWIDHSSPGLNGEMKISLVSFSPMTPQAMEFRGEKMLCRLLSPVLDYGEVYKISASAEGFEKPTRIPGFYISTGKF
ncbi:unnamed protein product [Calicophoron daubneyi]|uniref:Uncharacterized protein n=1 Tax=Calicophoron daubneyi TaxID=300641 RepID=A0AAV2T2M4_CALDB